ncbi:MAG: hypothetical protein WCH77_04740, partial [Planctomycetota bacterium]
EHLDRVFEGHRDETSAAREPARYRDGMLPEEAVYAGWRRGGRRKLEEHLDRVFEGHRDETSAAREPARYRDGMLRDPLPEDAVQC